MMRLGHYRPVHTKSWKALSQIARKDETCRRLMTISGVGPIGEPGIQSHRRRSHAVQELKVRRRIWD